MEDTVEREKNSLKERIWTIIRLWMRNKVSNCCFSIRDEEFEDIWDWKPIFSGTHFLTNNEALFNFDGCIEEGLFIRLEDIRCIKMREKREYLYTYINSFADKSMNEVIEAGEKIFQKLEEPNENVERIDNEDSE